LCSSVGDAAGRGDIEDASPEGSGEVWFFEGAVTLQGGLPKTGCRGTIWGATVGNIPLASREVIAGHPVLMLRNGCGLHATIPTEDFASPLPKSPEKTLDLVGGGTVQ
jgi:hypothetical protein